MSHGPDESAIRKLLQDFVDAWNAGDGEGCAQPFAVNADFTNVMGLRAHGRETIAAGHAEILATIYRGSRAQATVQGIRFVRPDVAVVGADLALVDDQGNPYPVAHRSNASMVACREGDGWSIVTFHNMIPFERPVAGTTEQMLSRDVGRERGQ